MASAARLAVQHAVAHDFLRAVLDQPGGTPFAAGLFVRHHGERDPARQRGAQPVQVGEDEQQRRGAALHVDGAAAMQTAVGDVARPGIARPAAARSPTGRDVEMAVQHQMAAGSRAASRSWRSGWGCRPAAPRCDGRCPRRSRKARNEVGGAAACRPADWQVSMRAEALQEVELACRAPSSSQCSSSLADAVMGALNCGAGASCTTTPSLITARHGAPPIA